MATPTAPARKGAVGQKAEATSLDYVQRALDDLDHAREKATHEVRTSIDDAVAQLRDAAGDLRERAQEQMSELERMLERAGEEMRIEIGRRAIRAQTTPEALTELNRELRHRRTELAERG